MLTSLLLGALLNWIDDDDFLILEQSITYKWMMLILLIIILCLLYAYFHLKLFSSSNSNTQTKYLNIHLDDYQFDPKYGFYKNKQTGELFCTTCLLKDIPAQLKELDDKWHCSNCGRPYHKDNYKPPPPRRRGDNPITNF